MQEMFSFHFAQPLFPVTIWYLSFRLQELMPHKSSQLDSQWL